MRLPQSVAPLRDSRFAWYFTGRFVSTLGSVVAPIALTFAVLDLTDDSASALGLVLAARSIPLVIFLLVGGVMADRFSRSVIIQLSHLLSALTQGAVAVLLLTGRAELWMIIILEALNGTVSAFTSPAMVGLVPQVVQRSYIQQANAMLSFVRGGLFLLGPSVSALLVVTVGSGWAIAVDAVTFLVASFCMAMVKVSVATTGLAASTSMWSDLRDGWSAFASTTWVWATVVSFCLLNMIQAGAFGTLGPVLAKSTIGIQAWGLGASGTALGLLLMTLVMMRWRLRYPLRAGMIGVAFQVLPLFALGIHPSVVPLVAATFLAGGGGEVFNIGWDTALQTHVPTHLLSRVSSFDYLGSVVAIPVGQIAFGPLAGVVSIQDVLLVAGIAYLLIVAITLSSRSIRTLAREDPEPAAA